MKRVSALVTFCTLFILFCGSAKAAPGNLYHVESATQPRVTVTITPAGGGAPANTFNVGLSWTASTSAAGCTSTATPACSNFGYNVFVGTTSGGESATPFNTSVVTGTTFSYSVTLTNSAQTFFFVVGSTETIVGLGTIVSSSNSNEASASFPGLPTPPTSLVATP